MIEKCYRNKFLIAILKKNVKVIRKGKKRKGRMKKLIYIGLGCLGIVLMACGSIYEKPPVGIGVEYSELKKSPCACLELKKAPEVPEWFS